MTREGKEGEVRDGVMKLGVVRERVRNRRYGEEEGQKRGRGIKRIIKN